MKKTYHGSCHCGKVTFEIDADISKGTAKCNCSFCAKVRNWVVHLKPEAVRKITGEENLATYLFGTKMCHHRFCKTCGVRIYSSGDIEQAGGKFINFYVATINDLDVNELMAGPIWISDGLHNNWHERPAETRHL